MDKKFVFHVVGNSFIPTDSCYCFDAYTIKTIKFCKMMYEKGHTIIFYGIGIMKGINANKIITVIDPEDTDFRKIKETTNDFSDPEYMMVGAREEIDEYRDLMNKKFTNSLVEKVEERYNSGDLILQFCSCVSFDTSKYINIQPSVGGGYWSNFEYVIFETLAYQEYQLMNNSSTILKKYSFIHPWFYPEDFIFCPEKKEKDTYLYMGRISNFKGVQYFLQWSKCFPDAKFWLAGGCVKYDAEKRIIYSPELEIHLNYYPNITYFGIVSGDLKKKLLSEATALIQPTNYFEPCGWNVIEAMISGTPVLTPNFGGFRGTVVHGVTGFLCESEKWTIYMELVKSLDPYACRKHALENFNEDIAYKKYIDFFSNI